ncbi:MAG: RNA methyltransferase [Bacteroidales bacterium]|jgi:tRNA G18 (ribose-2'-O)-methylase SpoU|nr:RNA methyltransferase [Bacteroidales bacterium]NPV36112.1 RNA methyltransferase [Bacteroidales bacterium]
MIKKSMEELNRINPQEFKANAKRNLVVVLDNIRSKQNIGSIFRTCDAFGIGIIFLCGISATPPDREIERTALGATLSVDWEYYQSSVECVAKLKAENYKIISIEQTKMSQLLTDIDFQDIRAAIVFGNEIQGVDEDILKLSDLHLEIPQQGTKHSLNVAVSAGIVLWELAGKQISVLKKS